MIVSRQKILLLQVWPLIAFAIHCADSIIASAEAENVVSRGRHSNSLVSDIKESLLEYFNSIKSIEYSYSYNSQDGLSSTVEYLESGDAYRLFRKDNGKSSITGASQVTLEYAFDGVTYQELDHESSTLAYARLDGGNVNSLSLGIPLLHTAQFKWLYDARGESDKLRWTTLSKPDVLMRRFAEAEYVGLSNGKHVIIFPQLWPNAGKWYYEVAFDPEIGFLPVSVVRNRIKSDVTVWSTTVQDFLSVQTGETEVRYPRITEVVSAGKKAVLRIDPQSVRLNRTIPMEDFRIDQSQAKAVIDVDHMMANLEEKHALEAPFDEVPLATSNRNWTLIALNFLAVFVLAILIWARGLKKTS